MTMVLLGCIADDLTGATDLANNLVRAGMRVVQTIGVPQHTERMHVDALVVALKSRTIPAPDAVALSLNACRWLLQQGAQQIYFKVCSTFDSSPRGNIGPVIEALMEELGSNFSIATPAFPENGRTVFNGHLFVGRQLLSETGMRTHPLTPMTDANLVRVLQAQLNPDAERKVGLVDFATVAKSSDAIRQKMEELRAEGYSMAIADAVSDGDLMRLGAALQDASFVTAASGLALALPANWGFTPTANTSHLPRATGRKAIVAGSCSTATLAQVRHFRESGGLARELAPMEIAAGAEAAVAGALAWVDACWQGDPSRALLVYSTAVPDDVKAVQDLLGVERAGVMIESALAAVAHGFVKRGARQLIMAGGETAGACMYALNVTLLQIGPQIDPGVPWCYASQASMHLALKSGNFGARDFFTKAFTLIS